jgi:hypothetical protein
VPRIEVSRSACRSCRMVRISYHKAFDEPPTERLIEPYQLPLGRMMSTSWLGR